MKFDQYLEQLLEKELKKIPSYPPREVLQALSGLHRNWIGEFVSDDTEWKLQTIPFSQIRLTGMDAQLNTLLIKRADRKIDILREILDQDVKARALLELRALHSSEPILVRPGSDETWWVLDGMHRILGVIIRGQQSIRAWTPATTPELQIEAHVIYDLIKCLGSEPTEEQITDLNSSLRLLSHRYTNVKIIISKYFQDHPHIDSQFFDKE